ncbi:hypothetical protein [Salinibacterium sp. SWN1162]|uniref:hypothetical protein n=1 Tax=Salinibacterium sp. SWN1162 TaxID=2792053 RepID=UPI0018CD8584|nr:hypothetical protein [Salinibacterium sp. SWN1162]MBH0007882.1 hypothetical protein [Salinibacterium sp. SWN1162]
MTMDAHAVLAGPRGRRLCLAIVRQAPREEFPEIAVFDWLLHWAAHQREKARGQGGAIFGWGLPDPLPDPTVEEIVEALEAIPLSSLPALSSADLLEALADSVDSARCWHEPDGTDELLADARLRPALERIAEQVVAWPATAWWSEPLAAEQWAVQFRDAYLQRSAPTEPALVFEQWSTAAIEEEQSYRQLFSDDPTAETSGTWWSRPPGALAMSTSARGESGPVGVWLIEDRMDEEPADVRRVGWAHAARIFEIVDAESWAQLCRSYPFDVSESRRHVWYLTTGRVGKWMTPDWSLVARDFDAVHLSVAAYLSAAGTAIPVNSDTASVIAGWNPDATYWLTDVEDGERAESSWVRDEETRRWRPLLE